MPIDPLELAGLRLEVGMQPTEDLPAIATEALTRGLDSPSLRLAAGISPTDPREAREAFVAALAELGVQTDSDEQTTLWRLIRHTAQLIIDDEIDPGCAAHQIWAVSRRVDLEGDLRIFVGLASELADHPHLAAQINEVIKQEAAELLDRPSPRTWVLVKAGGDEIWPLWQPVPRRLLDDTEVPTSDSLREALRSWAATYRENAYPPVEHGMSIFTNEDDAIAFVEKGRALSAALQAELGSRWHVEYMPEPTQPLGGFRVRHGDM